MEQAQTNNMEIPPKRPRRGLRSITLKGEGSVYTLGGQRIDAQPKKKGVYIRGGKKFVR